MFELRYLHSSLDREMARVPNGRIDGRPAVITSPSASRRSLEEAPVGARRSLEEVLVNF